MRRFWLFAYLSSNPNSRTGYSSSTILVFKMMTIQGWTVAKLEKYVASRNISLDILWSTRARFKSRRILVTPR